MVTRVSSYNAVAAGLLRDARIKAGLKQSDLAELIGERQQFVSKYETGERRLDIGTALEICNALELSFVDFADALAKKHGERKR